MPPAVAAIAAYLGELGVSAFWANVIAHAVVIVAEGAALNAISKKPKLPGYLSELQDRHHVIRSAVAPHRVVLGQSITSGPLVGAISKTGPTGTEHEILYLVVALAAHECESIDTVLLNNKASTDIRYGATEVDVVMDGSYYKLGVGGTLTITIDGTPFTVNAVDDEEPDYSGSNSAAENPIMHNRTNVANLVAEVQNDPGYSAAGYTIETGLQEFSQVEGQLDQRNRWHILVRSTTSTSITVTTGTTGDHGITLDASNARNPDDYLNISENLGASDQAADTMLLADLPSYVTADHRLRNICYLAAKLTWNPDVWYTGIPNIGAVVHGVNHIYDPRDLSTGWSDNPALIVRWLLTHESGMNVDEARIDDASFIAAANICDEVVANGPSASGKRFTCNGSFTRDEKPKDIVGAVLSCMGGRLTYWNGKYRVHAAAYDTPTITITEDDLRGPARLQVRTSRRDLFNSVRGTYVEPDKDWQPMDYPSVTNATYVSEDSGEEIWGDLSLPFTIDPWEAQRLAKIELERNRRGMTLQLPCKWTALNIRIWDTVTFDSATFGWSKVFRVVGMSLNPADGVDLTLKEEESAIYDWDTGDGSEPTDPSDPQYPDGSIEPPYDPGYTILSFTTTACVRLWVTRSPSPFVVGYQFEYRNATNTEWHHGTDVAWQSRWADGDEIYGIICNVPVGNYVVRIRAVGANGAYSSWVELSVRVDKPPVTLGPNVSGLELVDGLNSTQFTTKDPKFVWRQVGAYNQDGTDFYLKDYEVKFYDGETLVATAYTTNEEYIVHYDDNARLYQENNGTAGAYRTFTIEVRARGQQGQVSEVPASLTVSNPSPDEPTNVVVTASAGGAIEASFTPPDDIDWSGTLIFVSQSPGFTPSGTTVGDGNCVYDGPDHVVRWVGLTAGTTYYYRMASYDVFSKSGLTLSEIEGSVTIPAFDPNDATAPATPTGLSTSTGLVNTSQASLAYIEASWTANAESDLAGYIVRYGRNGVANWTTLAGVTELKVGSSTTKFRWESAIPGVTYEGKIAAYDKTGNVSSFTSLATQIAQTDTSAPSAPTGVSLTAVVRSLYLTFTGVSEADLAYYEVYASTSSGFTPDTSTFTNLYARSLATAYTYENASDNTYYVKICAVDWSGNRSSFTTQVSATIAKVTGSQIGSSTVANSNMASNSVDTSQLVSEAVTEAKIGSTAVTTAKLGSASVTSAKRQAVNSAGTYYGSIAANSLSSTFTIGTDTGAGIPTLGALTSGNSLVAVWAYDVDSSYIYCRAYNFDSSSQAGTAYVYYW